MTAELERDEETKAWAEVLGRWDDEGAHRAYLARFPDLEGLAVAGRRYRDALAARPGDPVAARFREEVLRRATAQALMGVQRLPAREVPRNLGRALFFVAAAALAAALLWLVPRLGLLAGAKP